MLHNSHIAIHRFAIKTAEDHRIGSEPTIHMNKAINQVNIIPLSEQCNKGHSEPLRMYDSYDMYVNRPTIQHAFVATNTQYRKKTTLMLSPMSPMMF